MTDQAMSDKQRPNEGSMTTGPVMTGAPTWIDLMTTDVERARTFYSALFGWQLSDTGEDFGHYQMATLDGANIAGIMAKTPEMDDVPDVWTVYLLTDDTAATTTAAREHGGQVWVEQMPIGDLGVMGMVADSSGAVIGVWQNGGIEKLAEPGTPAWFELLTKDYASAVPFYRDGSDRFHPACSCSGGRPTR